MSESQLCYYDTQNGCWVPTDLPPGVPFDVFYSYDRTNGYKCLLCQKFVTDQHLAQSGHIWWRNHKANELLKVGPPHRQQPPPPQPPPAQHWAPPPSQQQPQQMPFQPTASPPQQPYQGQQLPQQMRFQPTASPPQQPPPCPTQQTNKLPPWVAGGGIPSSTAAAEAAARTSTGASASASQDDAPPPPYWEEPAPPPDVRDVPPDAYQGPPPQPDVLSALASIEYRLARLEAKLDKLDQFCVQAARAAGWVRP
jgi:hypothetical protein